jgi:23S rRNA (adenine2030-N6)-methyltransferase
MPTRSRALNYRHHFHAGNFADLVKHAALTAALKLLQADKAPLLVIDTHAGAGRYRLDHRSVVSGEAAAAKRLMMDPEAPPVFVPLKRAVDEDSRRFDHFVYPGSPLLIARALRPVDRLLAFELREDDHAALTEALRPFRAASAVRADGYAEAARSLQEARGRVLLLVDPPYERGDEYEQVVRLARAVLPDRAEVTALIWTPLKDLETLDRLARELEALGPSRGLVAEVRLQPLTDPLKMNGCAVVALNPPPGLESPLETACAWVAARLGGPEASTRLWRLEA